MINIEKLISLLAEAEEVLGDYEAENDEPRSYLRQRIEQVLREYDKEGA